MTDIAERIKKIIIEQIGIDEGAITENANLIDDLGADSLEIVELVMSIEEEFNIEIDDKIAEKIQTVADVVNFVEENITS